MGFHIQQVVLGISEASTGFISSMEMFPKGPKGPSGCFNLKKTGGFGGERHG